MTKKQLTEAVEKVKAETREAMQIMYDALNQGQQKQIVKNKAVKKLFELHGVQYE